MEEIAKANDALNRRSSYQPPQKRKYRILSKKGSRRKTCPEIFSNDNDSNDDEKVSEFNFSDSVNVSITDFHCTAIDESQYRPSGLRESVGFLVLSLYTNLTSMNASKRIVLFELILLFP